MFSKQAWFPEPLSQKQQQVATTLFLLTAPFEQSNTKAVENGYIVHFPALCITTRRRCFPFIFFLTTCVAPVSIIIITFSLSLYKQFVGLMYQKLRERWKRNILLFIIHTWLSHSHRQQKKQGRASLFPIMTLWLPVIGCCCCT